MNELKLTVDTSLPGMAGGTTTDLATIQSNILAIQGLFRKKIYRPGDIRPQQVLVITNIYQFICVINIRVRELKGYMSFINSRKTEFTALDVFHLLCPAAENDSEEMEERFLHMYRHIKDNEQSYPPQPVYFVNGPKSLMVEMMY
ncbi:MAG TPA: hypothetical protein VG738_17145 [Chitinophagaceae bacterium]|nr:hypothetical protein [Chitinophagaceae bacterium]